MVDTLLVDGVDIESNLRHIQSDGWGSLFATPGTAGDNYSVPGRDGEVWRRKDHDVGIASLQFSIINDKIDVPSMMAEANSEWADLLRMFPRRRPVELTRVVSMRDRNGVGYVDVRQTAMAELAESIAPNWLTQSFQTGVLTFRILGGCWFDEDPTTVTVTAGTPLFVPVPGTTDTSNLVARMTVPAAGLQTLANVSTGVTMSYNWPADRVGSTVIVDASAFTIKRDTGSAIVNSPGVFSHTGDNRFFVLDPDLGDNELTLSAGTVSLSYRGAWL